MMGSLHITLGLLVLQPWPLLLFLDLTVFMVFANYPHTTPPHPQKRKERKLICVVSAGYNQM